MALLAVSGLGWGIALFGTFLINHFELFGLRQVYLAARRKELPYAQFRTPVLYKVVRHPIYLGFILAFWAAPTMTVGHLVFAVAMLGYIVVAIQLEERDLVREYGARYLAYRQEVRGLVPIPRSRASDSAVTGSEPAAPGRRAPEQRGIGGRDLTWRPARLPRSGNVQ